MPTVDHTVSYAAAVPWARPVRGSATPRVAWRRGTAPALAEVAIAVPAPYTREVGEGLVDGPTTVERFTNASEAEPHCGRCGAGVELPRACPSCHRGNLAVHSFCGWCGASLLPSDPARAGEVTVLTSEPCESGAMTIVAAGEAVRPPAEADITVQGRTDSTTPEYRAIDGVAVVLLGSPQVGGRSLPRTTYRLELGEAFDVAAPDVERPATFTATVHGLRFEALGDLDGVYLRLRGNERPTAHREVRVEQDLGAFQAMAPGETLPIGSLAIIGNALVRIEGIAS